MTDIVEQLRQYHEDIGFPDHIDSLLSSSADEIERLRAAIDKAAEALCDAGLYNSLADARAALEEKE